MKLTHILFCLLLAFICSSCTKDLGNYDYKAPSEPLVAGVKDSTFAAVLGDSLIISPKVTLADADAMNDLDFKWTISIGEELREITFSGYPLKMIYTLSPGERSAQLTITDKRNNLFYRYNFKIRGTTPFSIGNLVLSNDNEGAHLSFIKPDKTVQADIYRLINEDPLPGNPVQLYYSKPLPYQPNTKEEFWVLAADPSHPGVIIDAATLLKRNNFDSQFFSPPAQIISGYMEPVLGVSQMGTVPNGVVNGKLYVGVQSTAPFADDYGKFANEASGDYTMSKYFTHGPSYYIGYDLKAGAFITFGGDGTYAGTTYKVDVTSAGFDPTNTGYNNLLFMKPMAGGTSYAFMKSANGTVDELSFIYPTPNTQTFKALEKRAFKGSALLKDDSKWVVSSLNIFYFSTEGKIFRYNPINEDIRQLEAQFNAGTISMLKISADDNTLYVGTPGNIYTLDISVGKPGTIVATQSNIPGSPIDFIIRK